MNYLNKLIPVFNNLIKTKIKMNYLNKLILIIHNLIKTKIKMNYLIFLNTLFSKQKIKHKYMKMLNNNQI